jgi:CheY-like chemotaxis protein
MPKNLLLADDSITIQKVVGITFANEDFKVTSVNNGEDAITRARELKPDVILADVVMPRRNGYEVCEAVKSDPALRHIPVLLLAGTFEAFDEGRAQQAQADGHISKPFESGALINKVRELVGEPPAPPLGAPRPAAVAARPAPPPAAGFRPPGAGLPAPGAPRPGAPMPAGARPPAGMPPPGAPRPGAPMPAGARPPGPGMPPGARPPGPGMPPGARPPGPGMPPGARPQGMGMPPPGAPRPGAPMPPGARPPGPGMAPGAARPGMPPAGFRPTGPGVPPAGLRPAPAPAPRPAPAPARPAARPDPFGFGVEPPKAAPRPPEEDFGDIDVEPTAAKGGLASFDAPEVAPAKRAGIELPPGPEQEPELAPMHAFVPPPEATGHAPAPAGDQGEAALRAAVSQASREVIERVVWEVVPQLAETIIRENLDRLVKQRQGS